MMKSVSHGQEREGERKYVEGKKARKTMKETEFCTLSSDNEVYFPEAEIILVITGQHRANNQ